MKKILPILIIILFVSCGHETPKLNDTSDPFIVTKIEQYGESGFSNYYCEGAGQGTSDQSGIYISLEEPRIMLPSRMYNIGDTIILRK